MGVIRYAAACVQGDARRNNEDNIYCNGFYLPEQNHGMEQIREGSIGTGGSLIAVFDGMGGESAGETAAYLAAKSLAGQQKGLAGFGSKITARLQPETAVRNLCDGMNRQICCHARDHRIRSMGTTVAGLLIAGRRITGFNLGDSRIYCMAGGKMTQISEDHNEKTIIRRKTPLTQFLGIPEDVMQLQPYSTGRELRSGERYLLCTDGLTDVMEEEEIARIMMDEETPARIVQRLLHEVEAQGAVDNTSIIAVET